MTMKATLLLALAGVVSVGGTAFALTGAKGYADRIALRDGYSQYSGKIDLRDATGAVIFYYWGGSRCAAATPPTDREIDFLMSAHLNGHEVSLDYADYTTSLGVSRCWDGGMQIW